MAGPQSVGHTQVPTTPRPSPSGSPSFCKTTTFAPLSDIMPEASAKKLESRKRPRTESFIAVFQEDAEFWFDDGTVILEAQNVRFRIYRGILAEHSPVLADMLLQCTQKDDSSLLPQTSPVLKLDDSPDDFRHFLRALIPKRQTS